MRGHMKYYKALRPDLGSWYDEKCKWTLGKPMPPLNGFKGDPCGIGYHLAKSVEEAIGYSKFPLRLFEAEPCGDLLGEDDTKARFSSAKITREIEKPKWLIATENFLASIAKVKFFPKHKKTPMRRWKVFPSREVAWEEAKHKSRGNKLNTSYDAAYNVMYNAALKSDRYDSFDILYDAAFHAVGATYATRDAALMARMALVSDLKINAKYRKHVKDRWEVWTRGYGLACDVRGIFYVYMKP